MAKAIEKAVKQRRFRNSVETAFVGLLVVAERFNQRLEDICGRHGITHTQYNVLRILRGAQPEGHPRFEIAARLISRAPDVTRLLDRLDRQGLIARGWSPGNRRHSVARITAKGLTLLDTLDPEIVALQDDALAPLTKSQVETLADTLHRLTS